MLAPFLAAGLVTAWLRHNDLVKRQKALDMEARTLVRDNESLDSVLDLVSLDVFKEFEVRKRLNFVKPGEKLVIFISPSPMPSTPPEPNFFEKIKLFFKRD